MTMNRYALITCLALAACTGNLTGTPPVPALMVAESDAGRTIEVERGRKVTLRLEANRTEGYRWSVAASGNALAPFGEPFYTQEKSVPGGGGAEYWSFMPVRSGKQELRFEYRRTWEIDKPAAKVLNYTVSVRQ